MVVSQCTLCANTRKGNKSSFIKAAQTDAAPTYAIISVIRPQRPVERRTGRNAAHLAVELVNDGPVTIWLDSREI